MHNVAEVDIREREQITLWESAQEIVCDAVFLDSISGVQKCPASFIVTIENIRSFVTEVGQADERAKLALNAAQEVLTS